MILTQLLPNDSASQQHLALAATMKLSWRQKGPGTFVVAENSPLFQVLPSFVFVLTFIHSGRTIK